MNRPLRAALIGCGNIASRLSSDAGTVGVYTHAEAYKTCAETELVALCDLDDAALQECGERWQVAARYRDARQLLDEVRPEIVSICTPDATHYELALLALGAPGVRGVLIEKPLALDLAEARELAALAAERKMTVAVNHSRRYAASHQALREDLRTGRLGRIQSVGGIYTKGVLHNGTHWFDLLRFLVGEIVSARGFRRAGDMAEDPTLDAVLELESGGWAHLQGCDADCFSIFEMDIVGTSGRVRVVDSGHTFERSEAAEDARYAGYRSLRRIASENAGMRDTTLHAVRDLAARMSAGGTPRCSIGDALRALEIALAVKESAQTGRPVRFSKS